MANYYDEYRNDLYNPDDGHDTKKPGRNANWKAIQKGFKDTQSEIDRLDGRVDGLEERVETAEEHVANLEERVTNEEAFNREQQVQIDANTAKNTEQDGRLGNIDDAIERIDAKDNEQDDRLDALEESQNAQDILIREHGNRLTAHDASIADINTRISRINAKDDEQDAAIANINEKDTEQDSAISDLADDVQRIDDSVNRVATDPATSRSTRIGNNSNNLTVSTRTENETKSMDFIDNVNEDSVQFGFLENDTGHMVTFGNLAFNFDDINDKNNAQDAAITTLQDKVRRTTTDPATSRSTRIGNDTNNLTVSAAKDAEGMSVQITDNADNDPIRVGFESDAGGDSVIIGNNSYKLSASASTSAHVYTNSAAESAVNPGINRRTISTQIYASDFSGKNVLALVNVSSQDDSNCFVIGYTNKFVEIPDSGWVTVRCNAIIYNPTDATLTSVSITREITLIDCTSV